MIVSEVKMMSGRSSVSGMSAEHSAGSVLGLSEPQVHRIYIF
jgi:hypothetical protein